MFNIKIQDMSVRYLGICQRQCILRFLDNRNVRSPNEKPGLFLILQMSNFQVILWKITL